MTNSLFSQIILANIAEKLKREIIFFAKNMSKNNYKNHYYIILYLVNFEITECMEISDLKFLIFNVIKELFKISLSLLSHL